MKPHGMGDLYAAQIGGIGFHSFPGEGAVSYDRSPMLSPLFRKEFEMGNFN
jgi:hypothetical protein